MLKFSTGKSVKATTWQREIAETWKIFNEDFLVPNTKRLPISRIAYHNLTKEEKSKIKDVGGFVGGIFKGKNRSLRDIEEMSILVLDADYINSTAQIVEEEELKRIGKEAELQFLTRLEQVFNTTLYSYYRTASYSEEFPRYRILIPLETPVDAEMYTTICQNIADALDGSREISYFDPSGFNANQLMYWPVLFSDATQEDVPKAILKGVPLKPLDFSLKNLNSRWANNGIGHMAIPYEKPGIIGAWCRVYDVHQVINMCAEDGLSPYISTYGNRYLYAGSTTGSAGARSWGYGDTAMFFHSSHGSDPISQYGTLNAFDLMRVLRFAQLDAAYTGKEITKAPSYLAMIEYARSDKNVMLEMSKDSQREAGVSYSGVLLAAYNEEDAALYDDDEDAPVTPVTTTATADYIHEVPTRDNLQKPVTEHIVPNAAAAMIIGSVEWRQNLEAALDMDNKGKILPTQHNAVSAMWLNDYLRKGLIGYDIFSGRYVKNPRILAQSGIPGWTPTQFGTLVPDLDAIQRLPEAEPWTDHDVSILKGFLARPPFRLELSQRVFDDAFSQFMYTKKFHPVREFFDSLTWDGIPRLDTLAIDFLGAKDTELHRMCMRKIMIAACRRIYEPGYKFDCMVVFTGDQGGGKTTFVEKLCYNKDWFNTIQGSLAPREGVEATTGILFGLFDEMVAIKKNEVEQVKNFISEKQTKARKAYGHYTEIYQRQCVFFGTSNHTDFLIDTTGNRRFWPIEVRKNSLSLHKLFGTLDVEAWESEHGPLDESDKKMLTPEYVKQVWAEAVVVHSSGESHELPDHVWDEVAEVQENHRETDPWENTIKRYINRKRPTGWETFSSADRIVWLLDTNLQGTEEVNALSVDEVAFEALSIAVKDIKPMDKKRINNILQVLGFKHSKRNAHRAVAYYQDDIRIKDLKLWNEGGVTHE